MHGLISFPKSFIFTIQAYYRSLQFKIFSFEVIDKYGLFNLIYLLFQTVSIPLLWLIMIYRHNNRIIVNSITVLFFVVRKTISICIFESFFTLIILLNLLLLLYLINLIFISFDLNLPFKTILKVNCFGLKLLFLVFQTGNNLLVDHMLFYNGFIFYL